MSSDAVPAPPEGPAGPSIDPSTTWTLALASLAAYSAYEEIPWTPPPNYRCIGSFGGWDGIGFDYGYEEDFGLVFKYNGPQMIANRYLVAFRGTDSASDVFEDGFFDKVPFETYRNAPSPTPQVSSGFASIYTSTGGSIAPMRNQVLDILFPDRNIVASEILITGHSLGGALSQLFTLDMAVSFPQIRIRNINFASPMVGDSTWSAACQNAGATAEIKRVINYWDFAPDYPYFSDYVPVGTQFETAFYGAYPPPDYTEVLARHSILNLKTVLHECLWAPDQTWTGSFMSGTDRSYQMWSTVPPGASKEELIALRIALHEKEIEIRGGKVPRRSS